MQKFKTIVVKGKSFAVDLTGEGHFQTTYNDEAVSAESLKSLTFKLTARISQEGRVNIRIAYWEKDSWSDEPGKLVTGSIIGIHGGNNNLLVKWDGDKSSEQCHPNADFIDPKHADELMRLGQALDKAKNTFDRFKKKHSFNGLKRVRELLNDTASDAD